MGFGMMVGSALGAGTALFDAAGNAKAEAAQITANRKKKIEIIKSMNYNNAKINLESKNLWDSTVSDLTDMNMQAIRNRTTIAAGISESGMEGRTMKAVQRNVEGQDLKAQSRLKENYERDYTSLLGQQEEAWQSGLAGMEGLVTQSKSSGLSPFLNVITGGIQGGMTGHNFQSNMKTPKGAKSRG